MNADHVGAEVLHLAEVLPDLRPLGRPIVLQQPALFVVIVIEAPSHEGGPILQNKAALVLGDADEVQGLRHGRAGDHEQGPAEYAEHGPPSDLLGMLHLLLHRHAA